MLNSDASTAKTLALVAIILHAIFFMIGIFEMIVFASMLRFRTIPVAYPIAMVLLLSILFGVPFGILWIALDYFFIYKKLKTGEMVRVPVMTSPVLVTIRLISGGFIPELLITAACVKMGIPCIKKTAGKKDIPEG